MLQPVEKEKNLSNIVMNYDPSSVPLLETLGSAPGCGSVAANPEARNPARIRAVAEAILVRRVMKRLQLKLEEVGMSKSFYGTTLYLFCIYLQIVKRSLIVQRSKCPP